jgi:hypothetical protein
MNSMPSYRDFATAAAPPRRQRSAPAQVPAPVRRGLFRRLVDAIALSHQQAAEREIARRLGAAPGKLNDEIERRIFEHLTGNRGFHP